jgi:6-phosphogluconolactonase
MMILRPADPADVPREAARLVATKARAAVAARGVFSFAVSGGTTPWQMLRALAHEDIPWANVHLFQVDERVAPPGDPNRNLSHLLESIASAPLPPENLHAMPVNEDNLNAAAERYAQTLAPVTGSPALLDLIHLGLGPDGHTASLVPGDPVLEVADRDVALCGVYQGRRRMTLTYPILNRARSILWLVTGEAKREMLQRLLRSDPSIPAGRVAAKQAVVMTDIPERGT